MNRILYIEDSVTSQLIMRRILGDLYSMEVVTSPREGIEVLRNQRFDLVITDYLFPSGSGMDVVVSVRQRATAVEIPIIAVSGSMDATLSSRLMNAGANACVAKPLVAHSFRALVNEMLASPRLESSPAASVAVSCFQWYEGGLYHQYCPELKARLSDPDSTMLSNRMRAVLEEQIAKGWKVGFTAKETVRQYLLETHSLQGTTSAVRVEQQ